MAGTGCRVFANGRSANPYQRRVRRHAASDAARAQRHRACLGTSRQRSPHMKRRDVLQSGALVLLLGTKEIARGATILAVRVWPAADYSRVTIESDTALATTQKFVANPRRLAVDIEGR